MKGRTKIINMADLMKWWSFLTEELQEKMYALQPPETFQGVPVQSLNEITLEQLAMLQDSKPEELPYTVGKALFGMERKNVDMCPAAEYMGICNMVTRELERIGALFAELGREFTAAEVIAGAEQINHGIFGLADWYARRMGIQNHDEAFATPWVRVYQCRRNDMEMSEYQDRLHKAQMQEINSQSKYR